MVPGWLQILLVVLVAILLFGRGKISSLMGDVAQGINAFRKGMREGETEDDKKAVDDKSTIDVKAREAKAERTERYES